MKVVFSPTIGSRRTYKFNEYSQTQLTEFGFPPHRKYNECFKCGETIFFDPSVKGKSGKLIPREKVTGLLHNCPGRRSCD